MNLRSNKSSQTAPNLAGTEGALDPRHNYACLANLNPDAASSASGLTGVGRMISEICDINFAAWARESRE